MGKAKIWRVKLKIYSMKLKLLLVFNFFIIGTILYAKELTKVSVTKMYSGLENGFVLPFFQVQSGHWKRHDKPFSRFAVKGRSLGIPKYPNLFLPIPGRHR